MRPVGHDLFWGHEILLWSVMDREALWVANDHPTVATAQNVMAITDKDQYKAKNKS
jgi:hypothetical protein